MREAPEQTSTRLDTLREARRLPTAPQRANKTRSWKSGTLSLCLIALCLVVGLGIGVLGMRRRYKARESVVAVNGVVITRDDIFRRMEQAAGMNLMRQLVNEDLQIQFAEHRGDTPSDAEVKAAYDRARKQPDYRQALAANGPTPEDFKHRLRISLSRAAVANRGVTVNEKDIRKFYEANIDKKNPQALYYTPEKVQVAVIVTQTEEQAKKARADLDNGIAWVTVVKRYSRDQSKDNNGVLPPILRGRTKMTQIKGLEETLFGLRVGQQVGPVSFAGTWWIIRCLDKTPEQTRPFLQVEEECRTGAKLLKGLPVNAEKLEADFQEFKRQAHFSVLWPRYKDAVKWK